MNQQSLTLELPADVYEQVRRAAKGMNQPLDRALVTIVRAAMPSLEKIPRKYREQLEAMEDLSDEQLWKVSASHLPSCKERRLTRLLDKNKREALSGQERSMLATLRADVDVLMLQKSYALLLLKFRGHRIPSLVDSSS